MIPNEFDGLLKAIKNRTSHETVIEGCRVRLVQNWLSNRGLSMLYLGDCDTYSNSALPYAMRKLITEWKEGKRRIEFFDNGLILLMKNY
jgi:hypothetical protein